MANWKDKLISKREKARDEMHQLDLSTVDGNRKYVELLDFISECNHALNSPIRQVMTDYCEPIGYRDE